MGRSGRRSLGWWYLCSLMWSATRFVDLWLITPLSMALSSMAERLISVRTSTCVFGSQRGDVGTWEVCGEMRVRRRAICCWMNWCVVLSARIFSLCFSRSIFISNVCLHCSWRVFFQLTSISFAQYALYELQDAPDATVSPSACMLE